jgi:NAD-dependent dihydropyrimidine dehydrogenase PreA subunit
MVVTVIRTGKAGNLFVNVTDVVDKLQAPGEGIPAQDKATVPVNPEKAFTLRVNVSVCPEGAFAPIALLVTE